MLELTPNARRSLDAYLHELRLTLKGCKTVDSSEVERDVLEHIESSLSSEPAPIDAAALRGVLQQLGDPDQWIPEDELSWSRKLWLRLRSMLAGGRLAVLKAGAKLAHGPEDFRLAYLSIVSLAVGGLVLVSDPDDTLPGALVFLLLSFCFARAALGLREDPARLGAQRWLLYPALLCVYGPLTLFLLGWPFIAAVGAFEIYQDLVRDHRLLPGPGFGVYLLSVAGLTLGWWMVLSMITWLKPGLVRAVFHPFAASLGGRRTLWLMLALGVLFAGCVVGAVWLANHATPRYPEFIGPLPMEQYNWR